MALVVVPYFLSFRRTRRTDRARKEEATLLGIDKPTAQFPSSTRRPASAVGPVDACPEHDVLGIVGGTATVVNGLKCVGHGKCESLPGGGHPGRSRGHEVARGHPASRPLARDQRAGLFVAGELGGPALVKNAIGQGRRVIERIAGKAAVVRPGERAGGDVLDVVIVGAGPAGLRRRRRPRATPRATWPWKEGDLGARSSTTRGKLVLVQAVDVPLWER
jgi:hypothetical protein